MIDSCTMRQSAISTSASWCAVGSTGRSAISALTGTTGVRGTVGDDVLCSSRPGIVSSDLAPLICPVDGPAPFRVRWPFSISPGFAASLAFFSLNCLYVVVLGITSARNSRLSMCETAVAIAVSGGRYCNENGGHPPRSLYCTVFRGFRSDLTTLCPCSARY